MQKFFGDKLAILLFAGPTLLLFTVFVVYPLAPELYISLNKHNGFYYEKFVGLSNYLELIRNPSFWNSILNTYKIVLSQLLVALPLSLFLAMFIDRLAKRSLKFFKVSSFIPAVLSVTVMAEMWIAIYKPEWGLLNTFLRSVGLGSLSRVWLVQQNLVIWAVTFAFLWQYIGLNMLLLYTGIKTIPITYYDAAKIEGATFFQTNLHITLPLLREVLKFVMIASMLGSMAQFAYVKIMTSGGPGEVSTTVVYYMYRRAFNNFEFGSGSAVAVLYVIQCLVITVAINKLIAREQIQF